MNKIEDKTKTTAPVKACVFEQGCTVKFADADDTEVKNKFSIVAYSGEIIPNHFWWGNLAFDLEGGGIKFAKKRTPVLQEHFREDRIGFSTKQDISEKVTLEGKFLSNPTAAELRNDMAEGFPMQASVYLPPDLIEHVEEGVSVEVNGHTLKGPGAVFRKGKIQEVSMCTLGADSNTKSKAFAEGGKEEIEFSIFRKEETMAEQKEKVKLTAETFAADYPELRASLLETAKAEGENAQLERFAAIREMALDDPAFVLDQFAEGKSVEDAKTALISRMREQKEEAAKQAKEKVDPATQEFSDDASKTENKDNKPKTPEEKYTAEFNADEKVQAEFGGAEGLADFIAFRKAEDAGLAKVSSHR